MFAHSFRLTLLSIAMLFVSACQTPPEKTLPEETRSESEALDIRVLSEAEVVAGSRRSENRLLIPDILYEALQALSEDRLLTPIDDNAHSRFKRVLALDAGNELALEGLQNIVTRYLQLAEESMRRGLFDEAETLLSRARFVDEDHPGIAVTEEALRRERESKDLFFALDYPSYASHSEQAELELVEIAEQAREKEAFFLITAPNDNLARWMVSVMREAVNGYRLRGNIELSSRLGIRLRLPDAE